MSPYARCGLDLSPRPVGVKRSDRTGRTRSVDAEILFIHDAVVAHDEGHDSRDAVMGRERDERESPNHVPPDDESPLRFALSFTNRAAWMTSSGYVAAIRTCATSASG